MRNDINLLINLLLDDSAREDERHDAAMDIGKYNDDQVLQALLKIASNLDESELVLDAVGESIARIWVERNQFDIAAYKELHPCAKITAEAYIQGNKPEWLTKL